MDDIFQQVKDRIAGLAGGSLSREAAAAWAMARVQDESTDYSSCETLWTGLDRLAGADFREGPGIYLHDEDDFRAWLADLER